MYEVDTSTTLTTLQQANPLIFTDDTLSKIVNLSTKENQTVSFEIVSADASGNVTVPTGAEVVLINSSDTAQTTTTLVGTAPVLIFQGKGGIDVELDSGTSPGSVFGVADRVVVGSSGNDRIVLNDAFNTLVSLGSGDSTVTGGAGYDTIVAGLGNSTIVGGSGHSIAQMAGNADDYTVTVVDNRAIVTRNGGGTTTDITNLQFVQLDNEEALVFAENTLEAAITSIYHAAFGRTADAAGLQYWFEAAESGLSLDYIAGEFIKKGEFTDEAAMTNEEFVQNLYQNTFARDGDAAGVEYWLGILEQGVSRAGLVAAFGTSAAQHFEGSLSVEAVVVGDVTIISNIV